MTDATPPTGATRVVRVVLPAHLRKLSRSDGELVLDGPFYQPGGFTVRDHSGASLRWEEPALAHTALHFEATAAARDITDGRTESPLRPLDDTLSTLRTMDRISAALSTTAISQEA